MVNRRKNLGTENQTNESWLIPYADMLTLLFALFVVLFAASTIDAQKLEKLTQTFSAAFDGGRGIMSYTSGVPPTPIPEEDDREGREAHAEDEQDAAEQEEENEAESSAKELDFAELEAIKGNIDTYIQNNDLNQSLKTDLTDDGLLITIADQVFFDSGSAVVKEGSRTLAREISNLLVTDPPRHVTIGGHTDNVPIHNDEFRSNWDLSAMRAINFMQILLENDELEPDRFSATGYGEYRPVAPNDTAEGRQQNRRVEVLILPRVK